MCHISSKYRTFSTDEWIKQLVWKKFSKPLRFVIEVNPAAKLIRSKLTLGVFMDVSLASLQDEGLWICLYSDSAWMMNFWCQLQTCQLKMNHFTIDLLTAFLLYVVVLTGSHKILQGEK